MEWKRQILLKLAAEDSVLNRTFRRKYTGTFLLYETRIYFSFSGKTEKKKKKK